MLTATSSRTGTKTARCTNTTDISKRLARRIRTHRWARLDFYDPADPTSVYVKCIVCADNQIKTTRISCNMFQSHEASATHGAMAHKAGHTLRKLTDAVREIIASTEPTVGQSAAQDWDDLVTALRDLAHHCNMPLAEPRETDGSCTGTEDDACLASAMHPYPPTVCTRSTVVAPNAQRSAVVLNEG